MKDVKDLTKEDRLEVYRKARETYKKGIANGELPGMCWCMEIAAANLGICTRIGVLDYVYNYDLRGKYWPEFDALNTKNQGGYWWPKWDTESRLKAFDKLCK
jgi:hypothetical protein